MRSSRKRVKRRDRRKAKQTGYRRAGKTSMGSHVGHGTSGSPGGPRKLPLKVIRLDKNKVAKPLQKRKPLIVEVAPEQEKEKYSVKATIAEILSAKGK